LAVPLLGAVLAGLFALLLAAALTWALNGIANLLPKINLGVIELDLGGWISGLAGTIEAWVIEAGSTAWAFVSQLVLSHAYAIAELFNEVAGITKDTGEAIRYVTTTVIPHAVSQAEAFAVQSGLLFKHQAEGAVSSAAVAAAAALAAGGTGIWDLARGTAGTVEGDVAQAFADGLSSAERFADTAVAAVRGDLEAQIRAAEAAAAAALSDTRTLLGAAIAEVATAASSAVGQLQTELFAAVKAAEAVAAATTGEAVTALSHAIGAAEGLAARELDSARTALDRAIAATGAAAAAALTDAKTALGEAVKAAEGTAARELGDAVTAVDKAIAAAAGVLRAEVAGTLEGVYGDLTGKAAAAKGDLSALPALLAAAIAAPIAAVVSRVENLERCSVSKCGSPSEFSKLLEDAVGVSVLFELGAWLAKAIHDPAAAEGPFADVVHGLDARAEGILNELLGL
jgi:hypothetical protein